MPWRKERHVRDPASAARRGRGPRGERHAARHQATDILRGNGFSGRLFPKTKLDAVFLVLPRFCCPRRRFGEFRRPFSPYEDPCRRPPKTDEVHLPIACKRTAPAAPAARARASTVWHLQPAQHIAMTACALLGRITLVGPVHHDLFGAIAV